MIKIHQYFIHAIFWAAFLGFISSGFNGLVPTEGLQHVLVFAADAPVDSFPGIGPANNNEDKQDPWEALQKLTEDDETATRSIAAEQDTKGDPWARLQAIYLPFTQKEEAAAETDRKIQQKVSGALHSAVAPYTGLIRKASDRFNVPREIVAAVILVESGGNPRAKAPTSTAAGLMQTISATFSDARDALARQGIPVADSPLDPEASIMAGTWYLDRMYEMARADRPDSVGPRSLVNSWKYPLQYYYAGPGYGVKQDPVVIIYSGGQQVVVDKPAYSSKVLKWAKIMRQEGI